jgi:hypothetical protein
MDRRMRLLVGGVPAVGATILAVVGWATDATMRIGDHVAAYFAAGVFSIGVYAAGVFTFGGFAIGIFAFGPRAVGVFAFGPGAVSLARDSTPSPGGK